MRKNKKSIKTQVWLLFSVIFAFNIIAVLIMLTGLSQNEERAGEVKFTISQSQQMSDITTAHINWVDGLSKYLSEGTAFTGSLDSTTCSFGMWLSSLDATLKNDAIIAEAVAKVQAPHDLIHEQAGKIIELNKTNPAAAVDSYEKIILPNVLTIIRQLTVISTRCNELSAASSDTQSSTLQKNSLIQIAIIILVLLISVVIAIVIIKVAVNPAKKITMACESLARGDLNISVDIKSQNEMGRMAAALNKAIGLIKSYIHDIDVVMKELSIGNFVVSTSSDFIGDFKGIQESIDRFITDMSKTLLSIDASADQVASGANLVSDSSMALSQGATEQASSVQQLTASLQEISSQTMLNAQNAQSANELARHAKKDAEDGDAQMKGMLQAMEAINASSSSINKIIKVIDDIAFQTNILALNAAVEAARAGQHGKGFAVVAEEVRTLAARSAQAAKETTDLIEGSMRKVEAGTKIANETASSLNKIVGEVTRAAELIGAIASASNEQAAAIEQINQGVLQVSQVVQNNAATSEESAAASEELSSQAENLKGTISAFKVDQGDKGKSASVTDRQKIRNKKSGDYKSIEAPKINLSLDDNDYGKY